MLQRGPKEEAEATNQVEKGGDSAFRVPEAGGRGGRISGAWAPVVAVGGWVSF